MLLVVGGLMASLAMPGRAVPTLALTATVSAVRLVSRALSPEARERRRRNASSASPNGSLSSAQPNVVLEWNNVSVHLTDSKKHPEGRMILDNVSGNAQPGRVLAILGPSGSGKTTLLNALAGRLPYSKAISLHGSIDVNGVSIDDFEHVPAYVTQEDIFFSQLTVQETLDMAARMRLPRDMPTDRKEAFVQALIRRLGLVSVTDTTVGDEKTRGISGGEKKRLSLGCELVSTPKLILCDEPTSGLDAFQAEKVMQSLRTLAEQGHTVICSIHQPSSKIFRLCDDMVLLADGRAVYHGKTTDAPAFFEKAGYIMPEQSNPAEVYLDLISVDFTSDETIAESHSRIGKLVAAFDALPSQSVPNAYHGLANGAVVPHGVNSSRLGHFGQIRILLQRAWRQITRDKKTNISRFMSSFMSALLFGSIYWRIGFAQTTIQDRLGLLQVCTINCAMTALVKTLNVFPRESVLVNRERVRGSYNVTQYFVSKLLAEMPVSAFFPLIFSCTVYPMVRLSGGMGRILRFLGIITLESFTAASYGLVIGALVPSTEAALAIGPSSFVLQIVFGGLYVADENVPGWASWIPRVSLIKHTYEALCVNEFRGIEFETKESWDVKTGEQVLKRMTWGDSTVSKACFRLSKLLAFNYLATYAILTMKKPRFERLEAASVPTDSNHPQSGTSIVDTQTPNAETKTSNEATAAS